MQKKNILALILYILSLLVFQEVVFRYAFPLPEVSHFNRINYMRVGPVGHDTKAIRNIKVRLVSSPDNISSIQTLNAYGFRDQEWQIAQKYDTERIFFVGDSFVAGDMVEDDETIPVRFSDLSVEHGVSVQAMNLGVSGSDLGLYADLMLDGVPLFKPDSVFLVLYANDLPDYTDEVYKRQYATYNLYLPRLYQLLTMLKNKEMLPVRWDLRTVQFDQPVPNKNNPWSDKAYAQKMKDHVSPRIRAAMERGDFNPYRGGDFLGVEKYLRTPSDITEKLNLIRNYLEEQGSSLRVFYIPYRGQVTNYYRSYEKEYTLGYPEFDFTSPEYQIHQQELATQCRSLGIPFLDLTPVIKTAETNGHHLFFHYDEHMTAEGYNLVAETMFAWWRAEIKREALNPRK